jgi:biotin transporter BioY
MVRKCVCSFFLLLSIAVIIIYLVSLENLVDWLGADLTLEGLKDMFEGLSGSEKLYTLSMLAYSILSIFGVPVLILLTSLIGLTVPRK